MASADSSVILSILMPINMQVISSNTGEENWVSSNAGSKKRYRLEALTALRQG